MIRVGIIGCGRIADQHAVEIKKIPGCEIVGVCDREELMAKQLAERFGVKQYFSDIKKLLDIASPNVVHITTPPQSHYELGKLCMEAGCNVMFEKPLALNTGEVEELIGIANKRNLKITVDHNAQFSRAAIQMRELIKSGFLGGPPVHMESVWCYSYNDPGYTKAILGDKQHWVRGLPGKLLHNIISHGVSKIAEFFAGSNPKAVVYGFTGPFLKNHDEYDIIDELRTIIYNNNSTTAYFTFSTQMNPAIHQFRIFGPKNSIVVDDLHQTVIKVTKNYTSYLNHFIPPFVDAKQYMMSGMSNIKRFIKRELYFEEGRKYLIKAFYRSVSDDAPLPISYREILITSRILDAIFEQLERQKKEVRTPAS